MRKGKTYVRKDQIPRTERRDVGKLESEKKKIEEKETKEEFIIKRVSRWSKSRVTEWTGGSYSSGRGF